jgi:predicted AlkP superfamily pyrophosphatase or phosphodiesterase
MQVTPFYRGGLPGQPRCYPEGWRTMTRRTFASLAVLALLAAQACAPGRVASSPRPKLVLGIVIDQFRYDYLTRFRADYGGGIATLLRRGAVFTNARYHHYPTVTAVGHALFMSGATPSMSGIVGNEWYDREHNKEVTSVEDENTKLLGGKGGIGASPRKLVVSTLGDEMKLDSQGKCRVIGISLKDRAAVLPAGHMADGAYWFDEQTGDFVSSTFYFPDLPAWVRQYNRLRAADRYKGAEWTPWVPSLDYAPFHKRMPAAAGPEFYSALRESPFGNELVEAFAERAIEAEHLGAHTAADLLTVSFSSNDYVGHREGPYSSEVRDMSLRTDRIIGKLLAFVDRRVGLDNVLVVLTSDHGVSPVPEFLTERKMPGGRLQAQEIRNEVQEALAQRFGEGQWIVNISAGLYLNRDLIKAKKLNEAQVEETAAAAAAHAAHIFRVYTREQLLNGRVAADPIGREVINGFFPSRSGDVLILPEPYWIASAHGTTHGSPFGYDLHVPVIFMGSGIKPGTYDETIAPNDIAPTLATLLDVETPSGATGRVLTEMLASPQLGNQ